MKEYDINPDGYEVTSICMINHWDNIGHGAATFRYLVNAGGVIEIRQHAPCGDGDKWFYDVYFDSGHIERVFDFLTVGLSARGEL